MKKNMLILVILFLQIYFFPAQAASEVMDVLLIRPEKFIDQTTDKTSVSRDPFSWSPRQIELHNRIKDNETDYFADLTLQAILWDEKEPYAVINNEILAIGEQVEQVTIKLIEREEVVLEHDGVLRTFIFKPLVTIEDNEGR